MLIFRAKVTTRGATSTRQVARYANVYKRRKRIRLGPQRETEAPAQP